MNQRGYTLIELVITIVIIAILALIAGPIYNTYINQTRQTEGKMLVSTVAKAERIYAVEFNAVANIGSPVDQSTLIKADARDNTYYRSFTVNGTCTNGILNPLEVIAYPTTEAANLGCKNIRYYQSGGNVSISEM